MARNHILKTVRSFIMVCGVSTIVFTGSGCVSALPSGDSSTDPYDTAGFNPELAYLESIVGKATAIDPQIVALLLQEYQSSGRRARGIDYFTHLLEQRDGQLSKPVHLISLSALGVLRAENAQEIPLLKRNRWVKDTITVLDNARALGGEEDFFSRFATGLVYSQLPKRFGKSEQAVEDLNWLVANAGKAPIPGLMRPVSRAIKSLQNSEKQRDSSVEDESRAALTTNFSVSAEYGATLNTQRFQELVPGRVYLISGLEFTEYYFILSEDRNHLVSIDAGTRPNLARAAYKVLQEKVPELPPLSAVLVTHAHWDHVGGHPFFRQLNPDVQFYGRDNYHEEIKIMQAGPQNEIAWFFGNSFDFSNVESYRPDVEISKPTRIEIGGTAFDLIPAPGSETPDAMYISMPDEGLLFVGDFIMPFVGAPFVEEGDVGALIEAMDLIESLQPEKILHGHQPLTQFFSTTDRIQSLKPHLTWLIAETHARVAAGQTRGEIHRANLMPDSILDDASSQQFYLVMRTHLVDRIYDNSVGYWESDLSGLDTLDAQAYGEMLSGYFSFDQSQTAAIASKMIKSGDLHLAERMLRWALANWPDSIELAKLQRQAALRLRIKYQAYNPFKFILYSELANSSVEPLPVSE